MEIRGLSTDRAWDYENGYWWFSEPRRTGKALAQYELYKNIVGLPGEVLEFGVYKAASLIRLLTFRSMLESPDSREVFGFDAFGEFPRAGLASADDRRFIENFEGAGGDGLAAAEVEAVLRAKGLAENMKLVAGDIRETLPRFLADRPATRVALLHLDMDVYEPTLFALETLWDRVVAGGVVMLDDYGRVDGATRAVDDFRARRGGIPPVGKPPLAHIPCHLLKPE